MVIHHYQGYEIRGFYRLKDFKEILNIYKELEDFNERTHKFRYGIFEPLISNDKVVGIFNDLILCLIYKDNVLIGFSYFCILNEVDFEVPLVQGGLTVISQNIGANVFAFITAFLSLHTYKHLGFFHSGIITTIPKLVEMYCQFYSSAWPNPNADLSRPPTEYKRYLKDISKNYVSRFFPNPHKINQKRFTLILDKREIGFDDRFHNLPMAGSFKFNTFCSSWINYEENEDLIIIGKFNLKALVRIRLFFYYLKFTSWKIQLFKHITNKDGK